jgi:hypothetical protein
LKFLSEKLGKAGKTKKGAKEGNRGKKQRRIGTAELNRRDPVTAPIESRII